MARPRKDDSAPSARERIVSAFWALLEREPYSSLTIRGLCNRARVNPNTFYRYFACMDELAEAAFAENLVAGFPQIVLDLFGKAGAADARACASSTEMAEAARAAKGQTGTQAKESWGDSAKAGQPDADGSPDGALADFPLRFKRIRLFAQSGSEHLTGIVRAAWVEAWLARAGKRFDDLTRSQQADLAMIAAAEIALLGFTDSERGIEDFAQAASRPLGQGILAALNDIACE